MANWAFVEHATNQLKRPRPGDPKHPTLWPSEASATYMKDGEEVVVGKCRRAIFFRYLTYSYEFYDKYKVWRPLVERLKSESKPVDKYMLWIWAAGEQAEEFLIDQSKKSGIYVAEQVPVYIKSHNISGKKDIEVYNPETGKLTIVEAKSVYGFGANTVLGSEASRRKGFMGEPRESNLMQIAIYHWWTASMDDAYEESRLVYIARDTGRYAEYLVRTVDEDGTYHIEYRPWHPYAGSWKRVPYTINDILKTYTDIQKWVDGGRIPGRDFDKEWSEERLTKAYEAGELGKTDKDKYEKLAKRAEEDAWLEGFLATEDDQAMIDIANENHERFLAPVVKLLKTIQVLDPEDKKYEKTCAKLVAALRAVKPKKPLAKLEKGDWQCRFCKWSPICYSDVMEPQEET